MVAKCKKLLISVLLLALLACVLSACLGPQKTVYFNLNYEGASKIPQTLGANDKLSPPTDVTREGYLFDGWYRDQAFTLHLNVETATPMDGANYFAKWIALPKTLSVATKGEVFVGDTLSADSFVVTVTYHDGSHAEASNYTCSLENVTQTEGSKNVEFSYTENGTTVTGTLELTVLDILPILVDATYSGAKVEVGGSVDRSQLTVTVLYNNGSKKTVTDYQIENFSSETFGATQATVSYTEKGVTKTCQFNVTVIAPTLVDISATYNGTVDVGGSLNKALLEVVASYTNDTEKTVTDFQTEGFSSETAGEKTVTVSYTEKGVTKTCQAQVTVVEPVLKSIFATFDGSKIEVGGTLDTSHFVVIALYESGTQKVVSNFTLNGFESQTAGEKTVTVIYNENNAIKTCTVTVPVVEPTLTGISVVFDGSRIEVGGTLSNEQLVVTASYSNGTHKTVTGFETGGFSSQTAGEKRVTVVYTERGVTKSSNVMVPVVEPTLTGVEASVNAQTKIFVGDEVANSLVLVTAHFSNNTTAPVTEFATQNFSTESDGERTATVSVTMDGITQTATFTYTVLKVVPTQMEIECGTLEVMKGETVMRSELTVTVTYNNGKTATVTDFEIVNFDSSTQGTKEATVSYTEGGVTVSGTVQVTVLSESLVSVSAVTNSNSVLDGLQFNKQHLTVTATYSDSTVKPVSEFDVLGFDVSVAGSCQLTVSYCGKTAKVTVTVPTTVFKLTATYSEQVPLGMQLQKDKFTVTAYRNDGTNAVVTDFEFGKLSATQAGKYNVLVSYANTVPVACQAEITVVDPIVVELVLTQQKDVYKEDQLDEDILSVSALLSDGTTMDVPHMDCNIQGFSTEVAGDITLSVTFAGVTQTIVIEVKEPVLVKLTATQDGTVFTVGETFRTTTLTVIAYYSNGKQVQLKSGANGYSRSGFSTTKAGTVTGTVSYGGLSTTVEFLVVDAKLVSIAATYTGGVIYDDTTLTNETIKDYISVVGTDEKGKTRAITNFTVGGFNAGITGEQRLTITHIEGDTLTTQVSVTVTIRTLTAVNASYLDTVLVGEQPQAEKFVVIAHFNNGSSMQVENFGKSALDSSTTGTKTVEISFTWNGVTLSCDVEIPVVSSGSAYGSNLSIHFLELGNNYTGDSVYIKAGSTDILIDAGSRAGSAATIGAYVDRFCTDGKLEYVIATHAHQDHIAGFVGTNAAPGIFARYECETIIQFARTNATSQVYNNYCTERDKEVAAGAKLFTALECYNESKEGARRVYDLTGDGAITMEVLYQRYYSENSNDENNFSVCVMIHQGENNYLFTGDLEESGESSLVQSNNLPEVVLFKGGHHGSYTASNEVLLQKIKPQYVCVCCCAGAVEYTQNPERTFPSQDFINRIAPYTDRVYVTTMGNVEWSASKNKWVDTGFTSMNGNIVFNCSNGVISLVGSNNNLKLKDTDWFKNNRTCPDAWKNGTSMYHD